MNPYKLSSNKIKQDQEKHYDILNFSKKISSLRNSKQKLVSNRTLQNDLYEKAHSQLISSIKMQNTKEFKSSIDRNPREKYE